MSSISTRAIMQAEGVLGDILANEFRTQIPAILSRHRDQRVRMEVAPAHRHSRSAKSSETGKFNWKASGVLHAVLRQFRLDFLRTLGPEELRAKCSLKILLEETAASTSQFRIIEPLTLIVRPKPAPPPPPECVHTPEEARPETPTTPGPDAVVKEASTPKSEAEQPAALELSTLMSKQVESLALQSVLSSAGAESEVEPKAPPTSPAPPWHSRENEFATADSAEFEEDFSSPDGAEASGFDLSKLPLPGNFYQDYFGFELMPFNNTPDTQFFFPSQKHQEALSRLIYAISERKGFVMISGEIGSGKSTLCRALLAQLPNDVKTALITHTHIDADQIVQAIAEDFGLDTLGLNRYEILLQLNTYLIEQLALGCTVCIIIDEAQNLSPAALEEVRMISNLETEQEKLVQLILLGQPNLRNKVRLPQLAQLRQRIAVQFHLHPLDKNETIDYIKHRLAVAKPTQPLNFTRRAMGEVYRFSGGTPRLINSLCDNALLAAFSRQTRIVTTRMIREAAKDMDLEPKYKSFAEFFRLW